MNLQGIAEAYSQVHEKKDSSYLETDMKKRQENNEKARKDMEKVKGQKNPHFEEAGVDEKKKNIRGNDSEEQKARLEKKRGMKLDDHPQFKKEEVSGIAAAYHAVYDREEVDQVDEAITSEKGKAKMKSMIDARTTDSGKAKKGKGQNVKDIQHIGRANVDGYGGTPSNLKVAKNPVKSNFTGLNSGTGNKAKRRADALTKNEEFVDEAMSSYDRNRKRAAQRAADRNAARDAGKTGVVPGVGYVTPRREKETYVDSAGTTRHKSGAKNEEFDMVDEGLTGARADRARQMQDSDTKSKGGKRTDADRDTAFRLGTGTGPGRVSDRPIKSQSDQGKGNAAKRRMKEELEGNPVYEATKADIKEFVGAMLGNAATSALANPVGAGLAAGTVGAVTGGKKKVKKSLATGAGAAAGAALGGLPGAVIGGIAGNALS